MKKLLGLVLIVSHLTVQGQQSDLYYAKGKQYYENNQFREALYFLRKYIMLDSSRAEVFKWRGNCYVSLNQPDSALLDYQKALALTQSMPELHYNLSNVYGSLNRHQESERHLRTFLSHAPNDIDGILQLVRILQGKRNDSSLFYLEKAYHLDSTNQYSLNLLGWEYFYRGYAGKALEIALHSRKTFLYTNELLPLEAYAYLGTGRYDDAIRVADSLISKTPEPMPFYVIKVKAEILQNTSRDVFRDGSELKFRWIASENIKQLDSVILQRGHRYEYAVLRERFRNNFATMAVDEIFMAYYGSSSEKTFSPYSTQANDLRRLFEEDNYEGVITECNRILEKDPFNLRVLESLALGQYSLKDFVSFQATLKRYVGIVEGILATGTGESEDSAYIVISPVHEYDVLAYVGGESVSQALANNNGHAYDILSIKTETGEEDKLYFNIDKPMQSLRVLFDKTPDGKKEKAKRKKNRKRAAG
ncbi:MAG TPA: DUF4919 domain-containing protein [Chryseosolibacter sp.]|nr:DUF4919 domain-containing protein [Chryseosolibacter sp.]